MPHDHHHHARRNILSDFDSWLGFGGGNEPTQTQDPAVSIVYVTESPTFTGDIGGYVTGTQSKDPESTATAGKGDPVQQTRTTHTTKPPETEPTSTSTTSTTTKKKTTDLSTSTITSVPSTTTTFSTAAATTTSLATTSVLSADLDQATSSSTPSASPSAAASSSGGLSGGAKAGIAIGVLLAVAAIAGLVLFWLHKQKKNREEAAAAEAAAADREKPYVPSQPPLTNSQPPMTYVPNSSNPTRQVGLRPSAQLNSVPNQPAGGNAYAAGAVGAAAGAAAAAGAGAVASRGNQDPYLPYNGSANSPPGRRDPFTDPDNPFDTSAQSTSPPPPVAKDTPAEAGQVRELTPSPTGSGTGIPSSLSAGKPATQAGEAAAAGVVAGAVAGAAVAAAAAAKKSDEHPQQRTPSPEWREESPDSGSRPQSPSVGGAPFASNVHRVQMDFTPTLADEMELRAGQLVRMLKAYDDGWAQCSTMDGSVKGIAPRTCLSARPLQPRRPPGPGQGPPRGPPYMGPNGRPMSPAGGRGPPNGAPPRFYQDGRPMTPTQQGQNFAIPPPVSRSMSPDMPRPLTPGGSSRPASPSNSGRARSNSSSVAQNSRPPIVQAGPSPLAPPTGPLPGPPAQAVDRSQSPIGRKPVPGSQ